MANVLGGCWPTANPASAFTGHYAESKGERAIRLCQLARRKFKVGMTVNELAEMLGYPAWLERRRIILFLVLSGYIPIRCERRQTPILLNLRVTLPARIWFTVDGRITSEELHAILTGTASDETVATKGEMKVTNFTIQTSDG